MRFIWQSHRIRRLNERILYYHEAAEYDIQDALSDVLERMFEYEEKLTSSLYAASVTISLKAAYRKSANSMFPLTDYLPIWDLRCITFLYAREFDVDMFCCMLRTCLCKRPVILYDSLQTAFRRFKTPLNISTDVIFHNLRCAPLVDAVEQFIEDNMYVTFITERHKV